MSQTTISPSRVPHHRKTTLLGAVTGRDNITLDIVRMFFAAFGLIFIGLTLFSVLWGDHAFDGLRFCQGAGILMGSAGAALGLKGHTEPDARPYAYADVAPRQFVDQGPR